MARCRPEGRAQRRQAVPGLSRPASGSHNIAEIALHHAYCSRAVRSQLSGRPAEPFVIEGEDWFELDGESGLTWPAVLAVVEVEQQRLSTIVAAIADGSATSPLSDVERFDLVLGVTCHAVYHAGQVQLVKRLLAS